MPDMSAESSWTRLHSWLDTFPGFESHVEQVEIPGTSLPAGPSANGASELLALRMHHELTAGAGRGLVASSSRKAEEALLVIPSGALLNPLTLLASPLNSIPSHLFPSAPTHRAKKRRTSTSGSLNTTQLLTLHLVLTRDTEKRHPSAWQTYIDSIPQDFSWHPLSWIHAGDRRISTVPEAARRKVAGVHRRFEEDLAVLKRVVDEEEVFSGQELGLTDSDYLWAWLSVNTRTVSIPLGYFGPTELYNHTLVPVLDMVNHSSSPSILRPRHIPSLSSKSPRPARPGARTATPHLIPGRIAFALVAPPEGIAEGAEITFQYHSQCNLDLWAEYGFAEVTDTIEKFGKYSAADVGYLIDELWVLDEEKQAALEKIACWNENTLHPYPEYEASHGLLMTLRVLHLGESERNKLAPIAKALTTFVSEENEAKLRATLRNICRRCLEEAETRVKGDDAMVEALWQEQEDVARGCLQIYAHHLQHQNPLEKRFFTSHPSKGVGLTE